MPYRRLPNTDKSRLKALQIAVDQYLIDKDADAAPFGGDFHLSISSFIRQFESSVTNVVDAKNRQNNDTSAYNESLKKAKIYISHFIQVMNLCIIRGELKPQARTFYGLEENNSKIPTLTTEQDVLDWGEKVIDGEQNRLTNRMGSAIYSPSIALVKVNYECFKDAYQYHKILKHNTSRLSNDLINMRDQADNLILQLWNTIEDFYSTIDDEAERRAQCEKYGITYVFRPKELTSGKEAQGGEEEDVAQENTDVAQEYTDVAQEMPESAKEQLEDTQIQPEIADDMKQEDTNEAVDTESTTDRDKSDKQQKSSSHPIELTLSLFD